MIHILDVLSQRGFIEQTTHDEELRDYLSTPGRSCYIGFDPTASSLHVGNLVPIMSLAHMQRCGHRPIALVGGGTGLIGDPSGKTEARQLLTEDLVAENVAGLKHQLQRFIRFENNQALLVNNADWLKELRYIPFLRDVGRHFSINRMIKMESCRMRMESEEGLSFLEFNYMVLQACDFLQLMEQYDCALQMGGSDQWGNIVAGIDLIRREKRKQAFGITFPLITTSSGVKMGKTHHGAVWLDPERTPPYDYFQFWVNTEDQDVSRFLSLFTFTPMEEIDAVKKLHGAELNAAKRILAFEATLIAHGEKAAAEAAVSAASMFGDIRLSADLIPSSGLHALLSRNERVELPSSVIPESELRQGIAAFQIFYTAGMVKSKSEARRLIQQGGAYINNERVENPERIVTVGDLTNGEIILRTGKKRYHRIAVSC